MTTKTDIKLLPCPFCGGDAEMDTRQGYLALGTGRPGNRIAVYCQHCNADTGVCIEDVPDITPEQVAEMWNRRAAVALNASGQTSAARDVLAERQRQIEQEGFDETHDDQDDQPGDLARAAACYAIAAAYYPHDDVAILRFWPWLDTWWKPTDRRRNLVKAGALILAEIERLDRAAALPAGPEAA